MATTHSSSSSFGSSEAEKPTPNLLLIVDQKIQEAEAARRRIGRIVDVLLQTQSAISSAMSASDSGGETAEWSFDLAPDIRNLLDQSDAYSDSFNDTSLDVLERLRHAEHFVNLSANHEQALNVISSTLIRFVADIQEAETKLEDAKKSIDIVTRKIVELQPVEKRDVHVVESGGQRVAKERRISEFQMQEKNAREKVTRRQGKLDTLRTMNVSLLPVDSGFESIQSILEAVRESVTKLNPVYAPDISPEYVKTADSDSVQRQKPAEKESTVESFSQKIRRVCEQIHKEYEQLCRTALAAVRVNIKERNEMGDINFLNETRLHLKTFSQAALQQLERAAIETLTHLPSNNYLETLEGIQALHKHYIDSCHAHCAQITSINTDLVDLDEHLKKILPQQIQFPRRLLGKLEKYHNKIDGHVTAVLSDEFIAKKLYAVKKVHQIMHPIKTIAHWVSQFRRSKAK